ncbi:A disintegrin and metalloproteinase with thrombospondin motifs 4, partial [Dissostichus eleginoides]
CLMGNHVVTLPDSSLLKSAVDKNSPRPVMWKRFSSFSLSVALLMSCNIKLAVSESSQLSVSLVVLACRAAHLCLLDKTSSTLP